MTNTIQSFWRKIANRKGYEWLKTCYTDLAFYQACLLYPIYIEKEQKYKLKVAFVYVSNYLVSMEVFNICERLPYVEIERITLPTEEPFDFYILSSPQLLPLLQPKKTRQSLIFVAIVILKRIYVRNYRMLLMKK